MYYITDWPCDMTVWGDIIVILCGEYNLVLEYSVTSAWRELNRGLCWPRQAPPKVYIMDSVIMITVLPVNTTVAFQREENCSVIAIFFGVFDAGHLTFAAELTWATQSSPPSDSWCGATRMSHFCWDCFMFHTVHSALIFFITVAPCIVYLLDWHGTTALSKIPIIYFSVRVWQIYWRIWQVPSVVISYVYVYI